MKAAILKHPGVILAAAVAGSVIGFYNAPISAFLGVASFANILAVPGQIYIFFLQMTVIPIIISAIASSLGKLMCSKNSDGFVKRLLLVFLAGIVVAAVTGVVLGSLGKPGVGLDQNTSSFMSSLVSSEAQTDALEISLSAATDFETAQRSALVAFFTGMVPSNIFSALSQGSTMAVVFFSITIGIAIGFIKEESAAFLINLFSSIFETFQKLVNFSLYLLPLGLVCLMAGQIAAVGIQIFMAMSKFIVLFVIGTGFLFIVSTIIIWQRSGQKDPFKVLTAMFEPVMLALATRNSMAALPSAINSLCQRLAFNKDLVNLVLPLGITLGRFGHAFYFGIAVFFVVQLYGVQITITSHVIIFLGVILAATATAGSTSGVINVSMISIALNPLNLPVEVVLVIFIAIDPLIDTFVTLLQVYVNAAATAVMVNRDSLPQRL
ncbi:MAG: dicarboxylate/amino acid:cation symporter [Candidatus Adiutrix sp.]|jgi:proton glutamate symport protein|nr:dicarboxylate/amino acid:cation symporter [Candidatus Adiutrix sp.]